MDWPYRDSPTVREEDSPEAELSPPSGFSFLRDPLPNSDSTTDSWNRSPSGVPPGSITFEPPTRFSAEDLEKEANERDAARLVAELVCIAEAAAYVHKGLDITSYATQLRKAQCLFDSECGAAEMGESRWADLRVRCRGDKSDIMTFLKLLAGWAHAPGINKAQKQSGEGVTRNSLLVCALELLMTRTRKISYQRAGPAQGGGGTRWKSKSSL